MSRLIAGIPQLKPDVRLGKAVSEFTAALNDEQKQRFNSLNASGKPPGVTDVVKLAEELNQTGSKIHSSWKPHGTRIQNALGHIQTLAAVGDVMIGGSQNLIASGVWSAVRMSLLYSVSYLSLFEKISDKLVKIGQTAAIHKDMVGLFPRDSSLRDMVCEYLIIIVDLCRSFVIFRTKNALAQYVSTFHMDKELQGSEDKLTVWAKLINDQVQFLHSQVTVNMSNKFSLAQKSQELFNTSWKVDRDRNTCMELVRSLSPEQDKFDRAWQRQRRKGTVNWVFGTDEWAWWSRMTSEVNVLQHVKVDRARPYPMAPGEGTIRSFPHNSPRNKKLVIISGLGKGKTVLMANIVSQLRTMDSTAVVQMFCDRSFADTLDPDIVFASLAQQFVKAILDAWSSEKSTTSRKLPASFLDTSGRKGTGPMSSLITDALLHGPEFGIIRWFVVIDGLDQMQRSDTEYLLGLLEQCATVRSSNDLNLCISLRSKSWLSGVDEAIDRQFLHISNAHYDAELRGYVRNELERRRGFRDLSQNTQESITGLIVTLSEGMYIWATLQIEHLFPSYSETVPSETDILGLAEHLPGPLGDLFDEALRSITDTKHQPRIFQLVLAARRPLTIGEILIALSVNPDSRQWNQDGIPTCYDPAATMYSCSGGLLELDEQDHTVHLIHHSVFYHLTESDKDWTSVFGNEAPSWRFSQSPNDLFLGKVCLKYLDLPLHEHQLIKKSGVEVVDVSKIIGQMPKYLEDSSSLMKNAGRAMRYLPGRSPSPASIDVMKVVEGYMDDQRKLRERYRQRGIIVDPKAFLDYASTYWIFHCDHFLFDLEHEHGTDSLASGFQRALMGKCLAPTKLPFPKSALTETATDITEASLRLGSVSKESMSEATKVRMSMKKALLWTLRQHHMRMAWTLFDVMTRHKVVDGIDPLTWWREDDILEKAISGSGDEDAGYLMWDVKEDLSHLMGTPFIRANNDANTSGGQSGLVFDFGGLLRLYALQRTNRGIAIMVKHQAFLTYRIPVSGSQRVRQLMARIGTLLSDVDSYSESITGDISFEENPRAWMEKIWAAEGARVSSTPVSTVVPRAIEIGLGDECISSSLECLRLMLWNWWVNLSNFPEEGGLGLSRDDMVVKLLVYARVPCHLQNENGVTILVDTAQFTRSWHDPSFLSYCTECTWADHGPKALRTAISNLYVSMVTTLAQRGPLTLANLFDENDPHRFINIVAPAHEKNKVALQVREMVQALSRAGLDVTSRKLAHGTDGTLTKFRVEPRY